MKFDTFTPQLLRDAIEKELERNPNGMLAAGIALRNLKKDPHYYDNLIPMNKAFFTKYKRRSRGANGKWNYFYDNDKKKQKKEIIKPEFERVGGMSFDNLTIPQMKEKLQCDFKIRNIDHDVSLGPKEVDYHIKCTIAGMSDLADILKLPIQEVSGNGKLAFRYGHKEKWYDRNEKTINLIKQGKASLAHEWAHFIDNALTGMGRDELSHTAIDMDNEPEYKRLARRIADLSKRNFNSQISQIDNEDVRSTLEKDPDISDIAETFARSFEAYVTDKMLAAKRKNSYLVTPKKTLEAHGKILYPQGSDRKRLNELFDNFFEQLRLNNELQKAQEAQDMTSNKKWLLKIAPNKFLVKAKQHKYTKRTLKPGGGYDYTYPDDKKADKKGASWVENLMDIFSFKSRGEAMRRIEADYKKNKIDSKFNLSWDGWKNHLSEYFKNKEKWTKFFEQKTEKKDKKPIDKKPKKEKEKKLVVKKDSKVNLSVMRLIHGLYGKQEEVKKEAKVEEKQQTTAGIKKDKKTTKILNDSTPENRADKSMEVMGDKKESWGMTFDEFKNKTMNFRDESIIKQLNDWVNHYTKTFEELAAKDKSENKRGVSYGSWVEKKLKEYKTVLKDYIDGKIDNKLKPNPSWDYIQKQYNEIENKNSKEAKSLKRKLSIRENKLKKEHERLIKKAIKDGKVIPANVLTDYPDIMKEDVKKMNIPDPNYKPKSFKQKIILGGGSELPSGETTRTFNISDYSKVHPKDVYLSDEDTILQVPRPSYIPDMDLTAFAGYKGREQKFDIVRLDNNQYIISEKRYPIQRQGLARDKRELDTDKETEKINYYLMNAETLAATWDYYRKLYRAKQQELHEQDQDREEEWYNKQKKKTEEKGEKWTYAPFKRKAFRQKKVQPKSQFMSFSQAFMIQDFTKKPFTIKELEGATEANRQFFENYQTMLKELNYKINDLRIQKEFDIESDTYQKGKETAYGEGGTKNDLIESFGVKVKRQNGSEIDEQDVTKIGLLIEDLYSVFGNRKEMAKKSNLKVSYAGKKKMHASKSVGLYVPKYKTIAISDDGIEGRGFTFAHEFTHFMDSYLGEKTGYNYASDKDGSIENKIASSFRNRLKLSSEIKEGSQNYYLRTCETFARAMEQYYAIKQGTDNVLYETQNKFGIYVNHQTFMKEIYPLCEQFLKERDSMLKAFFCENKEGKARVVKIGGKKYIIKNKAPA